MNKIGIIGPVPFSPGWVATAHIPALETLRDYELRPLIRAAANAIPATFFLSVASLTAKQPNGLINLAYMGALFLPAAVRLGVGLIRAAQRMERRHAPPARF